MPSQEINTCIYHNSPANRKIPGFSAHLKDLHFLQHEFLCLQVISWQDDHLLHCTSVCRPIERQSDHSLKCSSMLQQSMAVFDPKTFKAPWHSSDNFLSIPFFRAFCLCILCPDKITIIIFHWLQRLLSYSFFPSHLTCRPFTYSIYHPFLLKSLFCLLFSLLFTACSSFSSAVPCQAPSLLERWGFPAAAPYRNACLI